MLSKSAGIAVLTFSVGLLLATVAQAKTIKCTVTNRGTAVEHWWVFQFRWQYDFDCGPEHLCRKAYRVQNTATLFSGDFHGQGVNEYSHRHYPLQIHRHLR